jgi:hypothetical protein
MVTMEGKTMFGMKQPAPPEICEVILDRIGLGEADAVNLEIWWATFEGLPGMRRIHVSKIERKSHLVLARRGDRIRLSTRKGTVVGFENLSL